MEIVTEVVPPLPDLVAALEQATLMAKQLPTTTDPTHLLQIYTSLHSAHHHLSSFFSLSHNHHHHPNPPPPPPLENSVSSAVSPANIDAVPMQVGDEDETEAGEEQNSRTTIEKVEERMRDCFIQNKRLKRPISPSAATEALAAEQRRSFDGGFVREWQRFDPYVTRLRSLDLVYQFHG